MLERMMGVARLNVHTFEDVENDQNATTQALLVVIIVSVAAFIGGITQIDNIVAAVIFGLVAGIVRWAVWALVTFWVGTTILKTPQTHATWGQLARVTGFAQTPGVLQVFGFIPFIGPLIAFVGSVWQLVAMVIGVRQALDYESTWRAVGVVLIGFVIVIIPLIIIVSLLGPEAAS